jgi:hypothetical protein
MNFFLSTLILSVVLIGCSSQNAFTKFTMDKQQELSVSNSQTSKIKFEDKVDGIVSAIYLNEVDSKTFNDNEYFYISLYLKNKNQMDDISLMNEIKSSLKLNKKFPVEVKQLPNDNHFSHFTSVNSKWNKYYLATFKKEITGENAKKLNLVFMHGKFSSDMLSFEKGEH